MKKLFISVALLAATMVSCTTEFDTEFNDAETAANAARFDAEEPHQNEANPKRFSYAVRAIVEMHRQFVNFVEILPANLAKKILDDTYTQDEAIMAIYIWWSNDSTGETLTEWDVWDDFMVNCPDFYLAFYGFYF